jgi:hypothetical protein
MLLPVKDAAEALGVSVSGVRRGLKSRRYAGHKRETPQGHVWLIEVPDDGAVTTRTLATRVPPYPADAPAAPDAPQEPPGGALLNERAAEMARYNRELLAPVLARLEQQATEIGVLTERTTTLPGQLNEATAKIAELEAAPAASGLAAAPETPSGAAPHGAERRRRWARVGTWLSSA